MFADFVIELFRAVLLPEPEEDFARRGRPAFARCVGVPRVANVVIDFGGVAGCEFARRERAGLADDGPRRPPIAMTVAEVTVLGDEERGQSRTAPLCFGWAASFWSASWRSAALGDVKDLRLRRPALSRQSA